MLGLNALGIETEPWACETARAAGHERLQADVAELDPHEFSPVWGLVGSPPCQAYSTAGKGLGRADKPIGDRVRARARRRERHPSRTPEGVS